MACSASNGDSCIQVGTGGVVKDVRVHKEVIAKVSAGAEALGFIPQGVMESPIKGATSGNTEFLAHFIRDPAKEHLAVAAVAEVDAYFASQPQSRASSR